jgi:hypothetical protein
LERERRSSASVSHLGRVRVVGLRLAFERWRWWFGLRLTLRGMGSSASVSRLGREMGLLAEGPSRVWGEGVVGIRKEPLPRLGRGRGLLAEGTGSVGTQPLRLAFGAREGGRLESGSPTRSNLGRAWGTGARKTEGNPSLSWLEQKEGGGGWRAMEPPLARTRVGAYGKKNRPLAFGARGCRVRVPNHIRLLPSLVAVCLSSSSLPLDFTVYFPSPSPLDSSESRTTATKTIITNLRHNCATAITTTLTTTSSQP